MVRLGGVILLLVAIVSLVKATLIVHLKNDTSEIDVSFKAVYAQSSPYPFNVHGRFYIMQTTDVEELPEDLSGVIVLGNANSTADELAFIHRTYENKGLGYVAQYPDFVMFFKNMIPLPFVCILSNDSAIIYDLWEKSNRTLSVTIISDDNYQISLGRSAGSVFLLVITIAVLLATLAYVCYQLHSFKDGASVTKIALVGVLISNLGLIAERIATFFLIYTNYVPMAILPPIAVIGPPFVAFSAIFISLYWSTLAFPNSVKMKSKQVFLPVLAIWVAGLITFAVALATGLNEVISALQIAFAIIICVSATYFLVVGGILIRILKKGNKIIATKRKVNKRLTYMLILAGISMYGIVIVGIFISLYRPSSSPPFFARLIPAENTYFATRALLSLFCTCSVATLAALFKKPKANKTNVELKVGTSDEDKRTPHSRFNEAR